MDYSYDEYMKDLRSLFKSLFGKESLTNLESTDLKPIDWQGIDVKSSDILATFPNIRERFQEDWIEYFEERNTNLCELFGQVAFHYGYDSKSKRAENERDSLMENINSLMTTLKNTKK